MDKLKLEYHYKSKGYSTEDFCDAIGISRSAYIRKNKGESEFSLSEIKKICKILELTREEMLDIFFANEVS